MNPRSPANAKWDVDRKRLLGYWQWMTPPRMFGGSFALLIILGTLGLKWLPGLYVGEDLNWLDALFTSTSAVCVTGLIVVDTATYFTVAGQAWILLLIQLGGLGMIAFSSIINDCLFQHYHCRARQAAFVEAGSLHLGSLLSRPTR